MRHRREKLRASPTVRHRLFDASLTHGYDHYLPGILTLVLGLALMRLSYSAFAQQEPANTATNAPAMPMMQQSDAMEKMAQSLTSMAEMCKTMMQMEIKSQPLKMAALLTIGLLLTLALVLFVLLEIQWLRFWSRRNKREGL